MMTDYVGQQLGNYHLRQMIGRGGSADVYLGEHILLGTLVAIKVLHIQIGSTELEDFLREARIIAHLRHPHIVRVLDFGVERTIPFLVMDYATHGTLRQSYPKGTRLPPVAIIHYAKQLALALQYAHDRNVVHGDVKPENMLLDINNQLLLSDFGISGIVQDTDTLITQKKSGSSASGTIYYMAPEQLLGRPHPSSDQYALAVVVYEWLCGARPFSGDAFAIMYQHVNQPPPPLSTRMPTISPVIERVVMRALAKDPEQRFASIGEFTQALEQASQVQEPTVVITSLQQRIEPKHVIKPVHMQWLHTLKPLSVLKPVRTQWQCTLKSLSSVKFVHTRKALPLPKSILKIGLGLILITGSAAFLLSSLNNHSSRATPITTPIATKVSATATSSGVLSSGNASHTRENPSEKVLAPANASQLVLAWKSAIGGGIGSAATVVNGIVYINANDGISHDGYMYALNINTGVMLWKAHIGSYDFGNAPTVANGVVYMGSFDDNLYAFNATTGATLWKASTKGRIGSSPILVNGVIYIGSDDGKLYAFNASTGKFLWSVQTGSEIRSSSAVSNGIIYVGSDDHKLYAIDAANGIIRWSFTTGDQVVSSPAVSNGIVYVGSLDHTFYAFNADTGVVLWKELTGGSIMSSPAVSNGIVYVGSQDDKLYALDVLKGTPLWSVSTGGSVRSSPTVANGVVYVGSDDHKLYAIDATTSAIYWTFTTANQVVSSPTVANGVVYIGSDDGNLYAFHLAGGTSG